MPSFQSYLRLATPVGVLIAGIAIAHAEPVAGRWTGSFAQNNQPGTYAVAIDFAADKISVDYADQHCGGTLEKIGEKGDSSFYIETITRGGIDPATGHGCIDGNVTLIRAGDTLFWGWIGVHKGQPMLASATLAKASE